MLEMRLKACERGGCWGQAEARPVFSRLFFGVMFGCVRVCIGNDRSMWNDRCSDSVNLSVSVKRA
jgi:hypothetical protein